MTQYVYTMNRVGKIVPPKREILKDISLSFFPGAKIGVLGLNGAGKSTLIKCLNKILTPQSGSIQIGGTDISEFDLVTLSKLMSYVPQTVKSSFAMDVFDVALIGNAKDILNQMLIFLVKC